MMKKVNIKQMQQPSEAVNRERYNQSYQRFISGQFTYNTHQLVKKISEIGQKEPYMYGVPLYKIMVQVVKTMMMNELQTLFLSSTLQEMKWTITDPCLDNYILQANDITPRLQKDTQALKVQFSLLLIAYIVKLYLNQENSLMDLKIREIFGSNFDRMYQAWVQKVSLNFKFNPKSMNRIFKEFESKQKDSNYHIIDYNKLVSNFFKDSGDGPILLENAYKDPLKYKENPQNDHYELPYQELEMEDELQRSRSIRLNRIQSQIGFHRRQSGNEFFNPDSSYDRPGIYRFEMHRSSSKKEE